MCLRTGWRFLKHALLVLGINEEQELCQQPGLQRASHCSAQRFIQINVVPQLK